MYIYEKYDLSMFVARFKDYDRLDQFSYSGLKALFEYLESLTEDTGEPIEVDVIALCCDFSEISIKDIECETGCEGLDELKDSTLVLEVDEDTIIYHAF